jgi:SAM-dependent methyltransferase
MLATGVRRLAAPVLVEWASAEPVRSPCRKTESLQPLIPANLAFVLKSKRIVLEPELVHFTLMEDDRLHAPAAQRNREPILDVLRPLLPVTGTVLEIASGSGEHVVHFARHLPQLTFQPSDPDEAALRSIAAWVAASGLANILPPVRLDVGVSPWPVVGASAIVCINMVHISPWRATLGLLAGAARLLAPGAPLYLYGPYRRKGVPTAPSNEAFDRNLRDRNPEWGLRDLEALAEVAHTAGFSAPVVTPMPANNLSVVFRRT